MYQISSESPEFCLRYYQKHFGLFFRSFSDISYMAIFAEVTDERIIDRHLRDIHPLVDYDASEGQSMLSI